MTENAPGEKPTPGRRALTEVQALRKRVDELEGDVQECRQLNKRLAEIADVVAEVLLPAAQRDEHRLEALLADYEKSI
jgi:hypothetical protein